MSNLPWPIKPYPTNPPPLVTLRRPLCPSRIAGWIEFANSNGVGISFPLTIGTRILCSLAPP